jgi:hypothetical protein
MIVDLAGEGFELVAEAVDGLRDGILDGGHEGLHDGIGTGASIPPSRVLDKTRTRSWPGGSFHLSGCS